MAVPAAISSQLTALNASIVAAGNLDAASLATLNALAVQSARLVQTILPAIPLAAGALDTFAAPLMPADITTGVLGLLTAAQTQLSLADLEGYVARIEINLENR